MPASAKATITIFRELRTAHSVVVTLLTSECGWLIWTPMKISPAATAATPAARKRVVDVMAMSGSLSGGPWRAPRVCLQGKKGRGDLTSPHDVIDDVTR